LLAAQLIHIQVKLSWPKFAIEFRGECADYAVAAIRYHLNLMTRCFPDSALPKLDIAPSRMLPLPKKGLKRAFSSLVINI
jgi:hypothetical protein